MKKKGFTFEKFIYTVLMIYAFILGLCGLSCCCFQQQCVNTCCSEPDCTCCTGDCYCDTCNLAPKQLLHPTQQK